LPLPQFRPLTALRGGAATGTSSPPTVATPAGAPAPRRADRRPVRHDARDVLDRAEHERAPLVAERDASAL